MPDADVAALAELGHVLESHIDELSRASLTQIRASVAFYRESDAVTPEDLLQSVVDNYRFVFRALIDNSSFDTTPAARTGTARALAGVPRSAVMDAFRVASHSGWDQMMALPAKHRNLDRHTLLAGTRRFWEAQDLYTDAMTTAYHETASHLLVESAAEQAALTEALLQGRPLGEYSVWDVAALLGLPASGRYVITTAQPPRVGQQPLPGISSKLRSLNSYSAWRLLPDILIGIIQLPTADALPPVVALLEQVTTTAVGISPLFTDLTDTSVNLRYARLAMTAQSPRGAGVCTFEDSVLAVAAVSAPEVTHRLTQTILGSFAALPAEDRKILAETFAAWVEHDGSIPDAATALFCHPNTVRNRLHRITEHTGRSLTAPRELAELCLAFETVARLPGTPD